MHRFYNKRKAQQDRILRLNALLILLPVFAFIFLSAFFSYYVFIIPAGIIFSTFICFIDVPLGKRNGVFTYYSPLLFTTQEKGRTIEIHGGTLFDYYFTLDRRQSKGARKRIIIYYYLVGLLNLIEQYELVPDDELQIKATSYILNERTATKVGFIKSKTDYIQSLTVILNILPILCAYFYTGSGPQLPNLFKVQTFRASVKDLKNKKEAIRQLRDRLNNTIKS